MGLINRIIEKLEKSTTNESNGHIDLSTLTPEERKNAFVQFGEGNENLTRLLNVAYEHGAESMFCCSGHGGPSGYVLFEVNEENLEYLQNVGKVLSKYNVVTNFENHYRFGPRVSFSGRESSDWFGIAADVMENIKDFDSTNPSIYYHEEMYNTDAPFAYKFNKGLLNMLRRIRWNKNECLPEPKIDTKSNDKKEFVESLKVELGPREEKSGEEIREEVNNVRDNDDKIGEI